MSFIFYPSVDFHSHFSDLRRNITLWFISCLESPWTIFNTAIHEILIRVLIIIKLLKVVTKQMNSYVLLSIRFPWGVYDQFMIQLIIAPFTWFIHVCSDEKVTTLWCLDQHENKEDQHAQRVMLWSSWHQRQAVVSLIWRTPDSRRSAK